MCPYVVDVIAIPQPVRVLVVVIAIPQCVHVFVVVIAIPQCVRVFVVVVIAIQQCVHVFVAGVYLPRETRTIQGGVLPVRHERSLLGRVAGSALFGSQLPPHVRHSSSHHGHRLHAHLLHHQHEVT